VNAQALGNFASGLYGNQYQTYANQQNAALGAAPQNLQSQLGLQNALYGAGSDVQNLANQYIQAPQTALNQYLSRVNGALGQTSTQTPAYNAAAGALGGGMLGSQLGGQVGGQFGGNGQMWGQIGGGLLGALLGS
jgi:hypothetical protein